MKANGGVAALYPRILNFMWVVSFKLRPCYLRLPSDTNLSAPQPVCTLWTREESLPLTRTEIRFSGHSVRICIMTLSYPLESRCSLCVIQWHEPQWTALQCQYDARRSPTSHPTHPWLTRVLAYERLDYEMNEISSLVDVFCKGRGQSGSDRYIYF
jgi:hypothetical protein